MKNLIKSRRGIAIEMAIVMMFIMIALSIVLISICDVQRKHMLDDHDAFNKKVEVYEITDLIIKGSIENDSTIDINGKTYFVSSKNTENNITYSITTKEGEIYLIVEVKTTGTFTDENNQKIITNTYEVSKDDNIILILEIKTVTDNNGTTNTITSWRD